MSIHRLPDAIASTLAESDRRIVITGASGWLGLATLELLKNALGPSFHDRIACFGSRTRSLTLDDGTQVTQRPLSDMTTLPHHPTLCLNLAFLTKDRADETDFAAQNSALTSTIIDALDRIGVEALFYPSSGAAGLADDPAASPAMRLYGAMKRDGEEACAQWAQDRGKRTAIVRLFNLSGPHINKPDHYALASFIAAALSGRPVTVQAKKPVIRSYVAIRELMAIILALLLQEDAAIICMDTAGECEIELRDLAAQIAGTVGNGRVMAADMDPALPPDRYVGDGATYRFWRNRLGIAPVTLPEQITDTARWMADHSK